MYIYIYIGLLIYLSIYLSIYLFTYSFIIDYLFIIFLNLFIKSILPTNLRPLNGQRCDIQVRSQYVPSTFQVRSKSWPAGRPAGRLAGWPKFYSNL